MRARRIDHFGLDVRDLARAERFYTEILGMTLQMRLADQVLLSYGDGNCALFVKPDRPPLDEALIRNPLGKSHHAFEVSHEDLLAAPDLFRTRGIPFHAPIDWGDHDCLYFLDPDGNLLELIGYRYGYRGPGSAASGRLRGPGSAFPDGACLLDGSSPFRAHRLPVPRPSVTALLSAR